ncbi:hypothetical protein SJI19_11910 [Acerihabitans sp. TG2]|uniref:hypothetical protein n=1 Tax=Acerihabitans sp. TG2 TaxID=3096008 RepID=UPI002B22B5EC|nr:hypothetical protein [Acerihabitans sp. TG2]MEA9391237.1 hypothetical protein [Acerihabitans sp. TG2]
MSIGSVGSMPVNTQYQASSAGEKGEAKVGPDHDGDADDAATSVSQVSSPSVNASGSVVGSVVNVKV